MRGGRKRKVRDGFGITSILVIAKPIETLASLMNPTSIIIVPLSLSGVTILFVTIALLN